MVAANERRYGREIVLLVGFLLPIEIQVHTEKSVRDFALAADFLHTHSHTFSTVADSAGD